jgi:hypothetical protein
MDESAILRFPQAIIRRLKALIIALKEAFHMLEISNLFKG